MTAHSDGTHKGTTEIAFRTSLGTPVEGLTYRLTDGQGNARTASTGTGGTGLTVRIGDAKEGTSTLWTVAGATRIQIDVQRDDGSWKTIGTFQHDATAHKQVSVIAGAVAMPFQMDSV
ncbi:hypothetical protein ACLB90_01060 [Stenotrophomonas sp. LGBM10]|uniref:hypothetical protein n=1 Tax=Stenotrophomonas sp. LGBM10 TaxID=3390038 RepID=UPI00398AF5B9